LGLFQGDGAHMSVIVKNGTLIKNTLS
jgi:hypothetical protein